MQRGPCQAVAVLISGQSYRFVYRQIFENFGSAQAFFGCPVDLYVLLSSKGGLQNTNGIIETPYEQTVLRSPRKVARFFQREHGFNNVTVVFLPPAEVDAFDAYLLHDVTEAVGGQVGLDDLFQDEKVFSGASQQFHLRHRVYSLAKASESQLPYSYTHFMWLREDSVFQAKPEAKMLDLSGMDDVNDVYWLRTNSSDAAVLKPEASIMQIPPSGTPSIVVRVFCGWGGLADKTFFGNRGGFDAFFGADYPAFVTDLVDWLKLSTWRDMKDPVGVAKDGGAMQPEFFLRDLADRKGVDVKFADFETNEVRFVVGSGPCIVQLYYNCSLHTGYPMCDE